ncbi:MAG: hypothetical protein LLG13_06355 [Bacteroidales bacterium]|nr:hypothetical protein [Bacteroidales bacterium]
MKTILLFVFLIIVSIISVEAQKPIGISQDSLKFGKSIIPGLVVTIPEVNYEKTLKNWIKELQSGTKSSVVTENSEMSIFGARLKDITSTPLNIYSTMKNEDTLVRLSVSFELKKDQYLGDEAFQSELSKAKLYLSDFAKDQYIDAVKGQVKDEEDKLSKIEKEIESLKREEARLEKSILKSREEIILEKDKIIVYNNNLASVSASIIEQNNQLLTMESGTQREEKEKYIKGLEKDKKSILKSISSSEDKINDANKTIDNANRELPNNNLAKQNFQSQYDIQQAVVGQFNDKLEKIKAYK